MASMALWSLAAANVTGAAVALTFWMSFGHDIINFEHAGFARTILNGSVLVACFLGVVGLTASQLAVAAKMCREPLSILPDSFWSLTAMMWLCLANVPTVAWLADLHGYRAACAALPAIAATLLFATCLLILRSDASLLFSDARTPFAAANLTGMVATLISELLFPSVGPWSRRFAEITHPSEVLSEVLVLVAVVVGGLGFAVAQGVVISFDNTLAGPTAQRFWWCTLAVWVCLSCFPLLSHLAVHSDPARRLCLMDLALLAAASVALQLAVARHNKMTLARPTTDSLLAHLGATCWAATACFTLLLGIIVMGVA